ncbi:uncharacterized protein [Drosophila pseudoobscura]|uniref:Uncharacterized protein isoform X2 n=1 Tax=Drosophila pseudoobscura pseudoobscura TaxID=46245 RepID=A0A6I8V8P3_DROPS|nr:uncharacterized protein LOC6902948 isoform X2 [Drosophila pseudoobscura]
MEISFIFIVSALLMGTSAYNPYDNMICLDCGDLCPVRRRGTSCRTAPKNIAAWKSRERGLARINTTHLVCVPDDLRLVEVDPAFCCIWAPEFGCRLVRSILDDHIQCRRCYNPKRKRRGYTLCPCKGYQGKACNGLLAFVIILPQMARLLS